MGGRRLVFCLKSVKCDTYFKYLPDKIMPEVVLRFPEGRYEGEVDDNKAPNGQGCLEFPGNDELERQIYEGQFKDKKAHGKGLMRWRQGDKYDGEFENGLRHGKGIYNIKETGAKYEGEYVNDLKEGQGKYTYGNGDIYKGTYVNNLRNGPGFKKQVDGEHREENWKEDKLVNFNVVKEKDKPGK